MSIQYVKVEGMVFKTGDYRKGGRWRGVLAGAKGGRKMWQRNGKRKRSWSYNPETLTTLEQIVNRTLVPEEKMITPYQDPTYDEIVPMMSSFALVEEAVKLYGVCPDGASGDTIVVLEVVPETAE